MIDRPLLYRPAVGIMLLNPVGRVFVGQRLDNELEAWQMPQGGIDDGEGAEAAALRELNEETGITPRHVDLVARHREELFYDLPEDLAGKLWKGRWRGQRQVWFLARFTGTDTDVNIATPHPEFRAWKWAEPEDLPTMIVPFKKTLYEDVLKAFRSLI
ncbi:RNA pyrophosphohydrolase [Sphingomonas flavalba]|uniref:RNA pyrophosphohydrolase n=1 Tax=Sphingomonas flavalba TaxID=2559804 RepID=UPI00109DBDED|nr:RNA pyrophosphohydrolase [Sphingomonas flavalba]